METEIKKVIDNAEVISRGLYAKGLNDATGKETRLFRGLLWRKFRKNGKIARKSTKRQDVPIIFRRNFWSEGLYITTYFVLA